MQKAFDQGDDIFLPLDPDRGYDPDYEGFGFTAFEMYVALTEYHWMRTTFYKGLGATWLPEHEFTEADKSNL